MHNHYLLQVYRVKGGTIPHQLSTINSLILNATQPLNIGNVLDKQSRESSSKFDMNTCKEQPITDDPERNVHRHSCEIDTNCHQKEISFKSQTTESEHTDTLNIM